MKFSLIIPIYNVEKFLSQCLESVLNQDIPQDEYEIICVIDGSPDNSINIVKEYQKKHSNIVLVEHENRGLPSARNSGLEVAKGEYIWFIDSDDFIVSNCLKYLYSELKEQEYDCIKFNYTEIIEEERYNAEKYNINSNFSNILDSLYSACTIICKKDIYIKYNLKFNSSIVYHEDVLFSFQINQIGLKTKKLYNMVLYIYRVRNDSIDHNRDFKFIREKSNCLLLSAYEISKSKNKKNENYFYDIDYQIFLYCTKALISTYYYDRADFKNILNRAKQLGIYPYKFKRKFKINKCKTRKQFILELFEYFICKKWFANLLAKFT